MRIETRGAAIGRGAAAPLPAIDLLLESGSPLVIAVETDERPLLLSLLIAGRLSPDAGEVLLDGQPDASGLRRRVALVDTPITAEPGAAIALRTVVAEELAFAGRPARRHAVAAVLDEHGLTVAARVPMRAIPTDDRIRLLTGLALLRHGVDALVVTSPDRHGGDPVQWFGTLATIADRGTLVVIVTDAPTAAVLIAAGARDGTLVPEPEPEPTPAAAPTAETSTDPAGPRPATTSATATTSASDPESLP